MLVFGPVDKAVGKLDKASMKGGIIWPSSPPFPLPGVIERIPTMMIGTSRPSDASLVPSPFVEWSRLLPVLACDISSPLPAVLLLLLLVLEPNLNILKKFKGVVEAPFAPSALSSGLSPLPCLSADAIRPFCNACRKPSNVPSSPSPLASETARG